MSQSSSSEERASVGIGLEPFRSIMITIDLRVFRGFCFILAGFHMVLVASE